MNRVVVIGGGPAGMNAALSAREEGAEVTILETRRSIGGIPMQCIHSGFGIFDLGRNLTGPEYSWHYIKRIESEGIEIHSGVHVLSIGRSVRFISSEGIEELRADAIVYATGAREKTPWEVGIYGSRPAGVYSAGMVQEMMNIHGLLPGKRAVVVGSGDIGLIIARRMALEGIDVLGIYEIRSYPGGLRRNIKSVERFSIPLYLSRSVYRITGYPRVRGVYTVQYDSNMNPIPGTEDFIECDTVVLSVGLRPDVDILVDAGAEIDPHTNGPIVDSRYMTSIPGVFAAGNCVHINDLVDNVVLEGRIAGRWAARYASGERWKAEYRITPGGEMAYTVPQRGVDGDIITIWGRVKRPINEGTITIKGMDGGVKMSDLRPSEMVSIENVRIDGHKEVVISE